jgi:O-antigen/teichoic acid export membrane protein
VALLRTIIHTLGSRIFTTIIGFVILLLTTRYLGAEGAGTIGLISASVGLIAIFAGFIGGGSLVYLIPRHNFTLLMIPAYIWALLMVTAGSLVLFVFNLVPVEVIPPIALLSFLTCIGSVNLVALVGKERITVNNTLSILQAVINIALLVIFFIILETATVDRYLLAMYVSGTIALVLEFLMVRRYFGGQIGTLAEIRLTISSSIRYGFLSQLGNVIQFLNYRLSFFLINFYAGVAAVGVYSVGVTLSESIWIAAQSISLVQYARIANTDDLEYCRVLTLQLSKAGVLVTTVLVGILLVVPPQFFGMIFGRDFSQVYFVIASMALGIIAFGYTIMISHYFAGLGRYHINTFASLCGLIATAVLSVILIPRYGYIGAGITSSIAYILTSLVQVRFFVQQSGASIRELFPNRSDIAFLRSLIQDLLPEKWKSA